MYHSFIIIFFFFLLLICNEDLFAVQLKDEKDEIEKF